MTAPDKIWVIDDTSDPCGTIYSHGIRPDDQMLSEHIEYARVIPDTITLPRAEVEALMEAADVIARMLRQCTFQTIFIKGQYLDRAEEVSKVRTALAALQERMK